MLDDAGRRHRGAASPTDRRKSVNHRASPLVSQRLPEKMCTDRAALDELLDTTVVAHIGLVADKHAVVFPTGFARIDDQLAIHGSTGSRWMRALAGQDTAVTVTRLDGIVVARSAFESSMHYRSAMIFGRFAPVPAERTAAVLDAFTDRVIPGRSRELRPSTRRELAATTVLAMPIDQWSLRVSDGWPEDEPGDIAAQAAWAGVVRWGPPAVSIHAAPDLLPGIPVPPSVHALAAHPERIC
jgi:uncharacterized protein